MGSEAVAEVIAIEGRLVGVGQPSFIIAEIGVNHNGDMDLAHRMVDAIADAGADCAKFQTFKAEQFCNSRDEIYEYVSQGMVVRESMFEMFERLELRHDDHDALFRHARERGLVPMSTPADPIAVELLERLGAGAYKIGSDDLTYPDFIDFVARKGKPLILSTGMADEEDVMRAVATVDATGNRQLIILHCVSEYPAPDVVVNLRKIDSLRRLTGRPIGFSDHSWGITAAIGATALGSCVIEKHFTMDRDMPGPDHRFSCDPAELTALVREVRRLEAQLGQGAIVPSAEERNMRKLARRSIVAARAIPAGTVLADEHLAFRRPGTGLMPYQADMVLGRRVVRRIEAGEQIAPDLLVE